MLLVKNNVLIDHFKYMATIINIETHLPDHRLFAILPIFACLYLKINPRVILLDVCT